MKEQQGGQGEPTAEQQAANTSPEEEKTIPKSVPTPLRYTYSTRNISTGYLKCKDLQTI